MLQIFNFVRSADNYNMTHITGYLTGSESLPKGSIEFFQATEMVDTSIEALLGITGQLWDNLLDSVRKSVTRNIARGTIVRFPFLHPERPTLLFKDNSLYMTAVLDNPTQVYIYRTGNNREECVIVQLSHPVAYAEIYIHTAPQLLLVFATPTLIVALSDISQLIWTTGTVPDAIQPLSYGQNRPLEASELIDISVAHDRGLIAFLLNDRTLSLLDLQDFEI